MRHSFIFYTFGILITITSLVTPLKANALTIERGTSATINWSVANAPNCNANSSYTGTPADVDNWNGSVRSGTGNATFPNVMTAGTFSFWCTYDSITSSDSLTVQDCGGSKSPGRPVWNGSACIAATPAPTSPWVTVAPTSGVEGTALTANWGATGSVTKYYFMVDNNGTEYDYGAATSWSGTTYGLWSGIGAHYIKIKACNGASCSAYSSNATFTILAPAADCTGTPWGTVASGFNGTAYLSSAPTGACTSQTRTCTNGTMSGTYTNTSCTAGCTGTPWGNVASGYNNTAYQTATVPFGNSCNSQTRTCTNGSLSGSYTYTSCTVDPPAAGTCGTANNGAARSAQPTTAGERCSSGTYANEVDSSGYWRWSCSGTSCQVAQLCSSTQYWNGSSCTACGDTGCNSCNASVLNPTLGCSCNNGTGVPGSCTPPGPSGSLSSSAPSCIIGASSSSCNVNLTWSTTNPVGTSAVTRNNPAGTVFTANSGTSQSTAVSGLYASVEYYLYNNATLLDQVTITPSCTGGTTWNGSVCAPSTDVCGTDHNGPALSSQPASDPARCQSGGYSNSADTADYWKWSCGSASCQVAKLCSSTQYWNGSSCTACGDTGCNSCTASVLAPTSGCVCNNTVGTPSACTPGPVNGVCSATYWDCTQGVATDQSNTATDWTWKCQGLNGGNTPNCSTPIVASSCGTSNNTIQPSQPTTDPERCAIGATYSNLADTNAWYRWSCDASDCTAYKRGCRVTTDSAYVGQPPIYPDNDDKCSGLCTNGNNDYPACVTPYAGLADLTAGNVTPAVATAGMIQPFHSTISNIGIEKNPGAVPFFNFFQYSTQPNGGGTITDVPIAIPAGYVLGPGGTAFYQQSFAFPVSGTFYIRMCTDKKDSGDGGVVAESNEGNNCSPAWSTITVAGPCANNATNFPACNTCPLGDSYWDGSSCTPCGATGCTSCTATIASPTDNCVCNNGNAPGACTTPLVNPEVINVSVTGQHYYSDPADGEAIYFTCLDSDQYKVTKIPPGTVFGPYPYTVPVKFTMADIGRGDGTYSIVCMNGATESIPSVQDYDSSSPNPPDVYLDAYPRSLKAGEKAVLSWSITRPKADCTLDAFSVCTGTCSPGADAALATLKTKIEGTDKVDNSTTITINSGLRTPAVGQVGPNAKALGKKTVDLSYTTDFKVSCDGGTKTATTRVRVTNTVEQ